MLKDLFEELKKYYDTVLVNCPSVLTAAEALIIAGAVDKRVLLIRHEDTPRAAAKRTMNILQHKGLMITGQVMTRLDADVAQETTMYSYAK